MLLDWIKILLVGAIFIIGGWIAVDWWKGRSATMAPPAQSPLLERATAGVPHVESGIAAAGAVAPAAPVPAAATPNAPGYTVSSVGVAPGSVQKYRDGHGIIHYTNIPEAVPEALRGRTVDISSPVATSLDAAFIGKRLAAMAGKKADTGDVLAGDPATLHLFLVQWCPHSQQVRAYLEQIGAKVVIHDIETDRASLLKWQKLAQGNAQVPLLVIRDRVVIGNRPEIIKEAMNASAKKP